MEIRAGDTVTHMPSGEVWEVAAVDPYGRYLYASGWPETFAYMGQIKLLEQCSDDEHWRAVENWAKRSPGHGWCPRHSINFALWDKHLQGECAEIMRL